jgi:hypothetical protein
MEFLFWNTATRTQITIKSMVDYSAYKNSSMRKIFTSLQFTQDKLVKAVIRHLPGNTCAENITVALHKTDYNMISVKQMTSKCPTPEEGATYTSLPLFPSYSSKELK